MWSNTSGDLFYKRHGCWDILKITHTKCLIHTGSRVIKQKAKILNCVTALHTPLPVAPRIKPVFFCPYSVLPACLLWPLPFLRTPPCACCAPLRFLQVLVLSPHASSSPRFGYSGSLRFIPWGHWGSAECLHDHLVCAGPPLPSRHALSTYSVLSSSYHVSFLKLFIYLRVCWLSSQRVKGPCLLCPSPLRSYYPCTPRELSKSCGLNEERNFSSNLIRKADLFFLSLKFNYFLFSDVKCESSVRFCSQSVK